ncbi:hypothetical protein EXIGLDRAFT_838202 [Exidia glandulosa HHB12029]|uniref:F-box domain-containing protein n=1 Tax=Exidia glandulosa HHB12029 TaxID=1314781 RepID=A0A165G2B4_EXIGL|nr:hypothetical protein EXIGLDRAFT_838202 [Exidia glandulosa HHB12029]
MLLFREKMGIESVIHVVIQAVLERTPDDNDMDAALDEIRVTVDRLLQDVARQKNIEAPFPRKLSAPTPSPPSTPPRRVHGEGPVLSHRASIHALSYAVLQEIFLCYAHTESLGSLRRLCLINAGWVCARWRKVVRSLTQFWAHLDNLSAREMSAISSLLEFSRPSRFHLEADLGGLAGMHSARFLNELGHHMFRAQSLALHRVAIGDISQGALACAAPVLTSLALDLDLTLHDARAIVSPGIFDKKAPRLRVLAVPWSQLPSSCVAFRHVVDFRPPAVLVPPSIRATSLFNLFPKLESMVLASSHGASTFSHGGTCHRALKYLEVHEENNLAVTQSIIAGMPSLLHERIPCIHLRLAAPNTITFIRRRLASVDRLFLFRSATTCHMTIIDKDDRIRIFSAIVATVIMSALRAADSFSRLTSLSIWEYVYEEDIAVLFLQDVPVLRRLTLFAYSPSPTEISVGQVHIFDAASRLSWTCRALRSLHVTAKDVSHGGLFPDPSPQQTVSARKLNSFVRNSLQFGAARLEILVLDGVTILEADEQRALGFLTEIADEVIL